MSTMGSLFLLSIIVSIVVSSILLIITNLRIRNLKKVLKNDSGEISYSLYKLKLEVVKLKQDFSNLKEVRAEKANIKLEQAKQLIAELEGELDE